MAVIDFEVRERQPFAEGEAFGETGSYERLDGLLTLAVDPNDAANDGIVDLHLAPRDEEGRVRFVAEVTLLQPEDASRGNGTLILDVPNRGSGVAGRDLNRVAGDRVMGVAVDPGDGFLFRHGFSVLTVAWQADIDPLPGALQTTLPVATNVDGPIRGQAQVELRPATRSTTLPFTMLRNVPYPPDDPDEPDARLLVREREGLAFERIPRSEWRFGQSASQSASTSRFIECDRGFEPGLLYVVTYTARDPKVAGAGLLALRDAAAFVRSGAHEALSHSFDRVLAFGVSQTGRVLRHLLRLGLTSDEDGKRAIDGLLIHIAGAQVGEFNHRFALPSSAFAPGFAHLPPFSYEATQNQLTGTWSGLLDRVRERGAAPKVISTNSSWEYWRGDAALLHTAPGGDGDLPGDPDARLYMFAGTQHVGAVFPHTRALEALGLSARHGVGVVDPGPLVRGALANLDQWVRDGTEPPASAHPRLDDGTAVSRSEVLAQFAALPGLYPPDPARLKAISVLDLGPEADRGIGEYPPVEGDEYPSLVSAVDEDLNETAGIRLPDITIPVGSHTGWNAADPETGDPRVAPLLLGITRYFAQDDQSRAAGDPRASIASRYADRETYLTMVRDAANRLSANRHILPEDIDLVVGNCADRYDDALKVGAADP